MPVWKAIINWNLGHRLNSWCRLTVTWTDTEQTSQSSNYTKGKMKQPPDNNIALIIPPCFLSPIIRSRLKKSKCVSFYWSVMNDEEVENKNKLYLWVLTSLGRCFEFISRICFDLDNLKDTWESQHNGNVVKCWWFWFFIFEVACL